MKTLSQNLAQVSTAFLTAIIIFSGCSINDSSVGSDSVEFSNEELELAGQIIAESVSDQKDGIFSSLNDAFTLPTNNSFSQSSLEAENYSLPVFKAVGLMNATAGQSNYSYTYAPETGKHFVSLNRYSNEDNIFQETAVELEYIYYDTGGSFVVSPRIDNDRIETIDFLGKRTGSIETKSLQSTYERTDQFIIQGLTSNSQLLTIDGLHQGSGEYRVTRENGNVLERYYDLSVEFINVKVNNQTIESNGNLKKGVTGTLAYELLINKSTNGNESIKTVNGTIEFNGDGTALLKFRNLLSQFKITLDSGNLLEEDRFEGFIRSVNATENSITLFNEEKYILNSESEVSTESDLTSLSEIKSSIENKIRVQTKGSFITNSAGNKVIQSVEFNLESEDIEFKEIIESVDISENSITLKRSGTLFLSDATSVDSDGDFSTLESIQNTLENGNSVKAKGEFQLEPNGIRTIIKVKFALEDQEFEDFIESADINNQSFTLADGTTYFVNDSTKFDENISSIEDLVELLTIGYKIEGEGTYKIDADGLLVVTKVEFDIEDFDESDFEGLVITVNIPNQTFTLNNGLVFKAISRTKFGKNIRTLNELAVALNRNDSVTAKGEFFTDVSGNNILIEVEFSASDNGRTSEEGEFEGVVQTVNLIQQTFVLRNGLLLHVDSDTEFMGDKVQSLETLSEMLNIGYHVEAEGIYFTNNNGRNIVSEVEFDVDREDFEEREFRDEVQSVNLNLGFFIVKNGLVIYTDSNTEFEDGDIETLEDLQRAIRSGESVLASGKYFTNNRNRNFAISVEFEIIETNFEEKEFEGSVQRVNLNQQTFTLRNGLLLYINSNTEFEDGDIRTLQRLADAINDGQTVQAKGDYYNNDRGRNIVVKVEFEIKESDYDEREFEGSVHRVNLNRQTFTLRNGLLLYVDSNTEFKDGNIRSLQRLSEVISDGQIVQAKGDYYTNNRGQNVVTEVEFEIEESDFDEREFEGSVQRVNLNRQTFTLRNGLLLYINSNSEFEDGDIRTMQRLSDAISDGHVVLAKGDYYTNNRGQNIVTKVEFKIDEDSQGNNRGGNGGQGDNRGGNGGQGDNGSGDNDDD